MNQTSSLKTGDLAVAKIVVDGEGTVVERPVEILRLLGREDVLVRVLGMLWDAEGLNGARLPLPIDRVELAAW